MTTYSVRDMVNVLDRGVVGDGVTDDGPKINALLAGADTDSGIALFFPSRPYRIATPVKSVIQNVAMIGEPGSLGWFGVGFPGGNRTRQSSGGARFLIDTVGDYGVTFGDGTSQQVDLGGPRIENITFSPFRVHAGSAPASGDFIVSGSGNDPTLLGAWAAAHPSGYLWTQGTAGQLAKFQYGSVNTGSHKFSGVVLDHELVPAGAYGSSCIIIVDGIKGGLRLFGVSNYHVANCVFTGFLDQGVAQTDLLATGSRGLYIDGAGLFAKVSGAQTTPGSGSYSLLVNSTAGWPSSGTVMGDGLLITYTSIDATHFLGCTGAYAHTFTDQDPLVQGSVPEPQYGMITDTFFWENYRAVVSNGAQMRLRGCNMDAGVNNTTAVLNTICLEVVDPGNPVAISDCGFQGGVTLIKGYYSAQNKRNGFQIDNLCRYESWAASGYALDIGLNDSQIYGRCGTSHASGQVFIVQSGALRNNLEVSGSTSAGEGNWTDLGTDTRYRNPVIGETYGWGPKQYTTTQRNALTVPAGRRVEVFDTTLGKPIWSNGAGTGWVDATGAAV